MPYNHAPSVVPAEIYSNKIMGRANTDTPSASRARLRLASDEQELPKNPPALSSEPLGDIVAPMGPVDERPIDMAPPQPPPSGGQYRGPLDYGDPGVSASLWREGRGNNLYFDQRAFAPMDLITVTVMEDSEGQKRADTKLKQESTIEAAISKLFGIETSATEANKRLDPTALINASTESEFTGEGQTTRRGRLRATISAMVAEVLPSGILRIEGQKIIAVNGEEQDMIISGLIRPRDINAQNEVDSRKIANLRIDYFGHGTLDEQQRPGWATRLILTLWPF